MHGVTCCAQGSGDIVPRVAVEPKAGDEYEFHEVTVDLASDISAKLMTMATRMQPLARGLRELVGLRDDATGSLSLIRITRVRSKLAFVGAYALAVVILVALPIPAIAHSLAVDVVTVVFLVVGVRAFRGRGEPVAPPRAWWRATSRPRAGFWIAGLQLFAVFSAVLDANNLTLRELSTPAEWFVAVDMIVWSIAIGAFYLQSSVRLVRNTKRAAKAVQDAEWATYVARRDALG